MPRRPPTRRFFRLPGGGGGWTGGSGRLRFVSSIKPSWSYRFKGARAVRKDAMEFTDMEPVQFRRKN